MEQAQQLPWYESFLNGAGEVVGEALAIKTAGYLNGMRNDAGLPQYPQPQNQTPPVVEPGGKNITKDDQIDTKKYLMIGGGVLIVLALLFALWGRK